MVHPAGIEPATSGLGNRCSILLSYGCAWNAWPWCVQAFKQKARGAPASCRCLSPFTAHDGTPWPAVVVIIARLAGSGPILQKPVRPVPASHDTLAPRTAPGKARWNRAVADNENLVGGGPQHRAAVDLAIKATDDRAAPKQRKISGLIRRAQRLQWGRLPIGGGEFSRPVCRQYRFRWWTYHCDAERTGMR